MPEVDIIIDKVVERHKGKDNALIPMLHEIQGEFNYLPREALDYLSAKISVPVSKIFAVATFYKAFSLEPRGKTKIDVCMGTACYVKNSENLLNRFAGELKLEGEGTTSDLAFTLSQVRCLGCCSLAPVVNINGKVYGNLSSDKVKQLAEEYKA